MESLLERIKKMRPYMTHMQAELVCRDLPCDANDWQIMNQPIPDKAVYLGVVESLNDYIHRNQLQDKLMLGAYWALCDELLVLKKKRAPIQEVRACICSGLGL